ncbi:hypothetical protein LN042_06700 [Kitasatospora sp. RB6PN24]|uniref:hypothetical protein n=1 Tax=Kitasatospora humi TaxID=2893891 RepID=UPI001E3F2AB5|nr:hypothetical protein [Kitasatospora humi]MCC9306796.1 hypothetical protein [Kitasatospora humi]
MKNRASFDHQAALADLHALGRALDAQVTQQAGPAAPDLDATLTAMRQVHADILTNLSRAQRAARTRTRTRTRRGLPA